MKQCMCCRKQMNGFDNSFHQNRSGDSEWIKCYRCSTEKQERRALYIYEKRLYTAELCKKYALPMFLCWGIPIVQLWSWSLGLKIVSSLDFNDPQKAGYYTENYIELESIGDGKYRATEKEETHSYDTDIYGGFGFLIKIFLFCFANIWVPFYSGWVKRNAEKKCKEVCSNAVFDSYKKARESIEDRDFLRDPKIQE